MDRHAVLFSLVFSFIPQPSIMVERPIEAVQTEVIRTVSKERSEYITLQAIDPREEGRIQKDKVDKSRSQNS